MAEKEYIEREAALKECDWYANEFCECEYAIMPLKGALEILPAADVKPVVRGKWVYDHWCEFKCSNCGAWSKSKPYRGRENFCPNCGADMRVES